MLLQFTSPQIVFIRSLLVTRGVSCTQKSVVRIRLAVPLPIVMFGILALPALGWAQTLNKNADAKHVGFENSVVLRDLTVLHGKKVIDFNDDSVLLSDEQRIGWDQILKASVADGLRESFDAKLAELGLPLSRLKFRLANEDWSGIGELAESMYQRLNLQTLDSKSPSQLDYLICIATMEGRIYRGDRAGAVLPFLQAAHIQKRFRRSNTPNANFYLSPNEERTMLSERILPIWFDKSQVKEAFTALSSSFVPTSKSEQLGPIVYLASLAIEMERFELAKELVSLVSEGGEAFEPWRIVLQSQLNIANRNFRGSASLIKRSIARGDLHDGDLPSGDAKLVASYLSFAEHFSNLDEAKIPAVKTGDGRGASDGDNSNVAAQADGSMVAKSPKARLETVDIQANVMLELLRIPASVGDRLPALSAAALYQTAQIAQSMDWRNEQLKMQQELLFRFPSSYYARRLQNRED